MGVNVPCPEGFDQELAQSLYQVRITMKVFQDNVLLQELIHQQSEASYLLIYGLGIGQGCYWVLCFFSVMGSPITYNL